MDRDSTVNLGPLAHVLVSFDRIGFCLVESGVRAFQLARNERLRY